jgi:hypothetical protein
MANVFEKSGRMFVALRKNGARPNGKRPVFHAVSPNCRIDASDRARVADRPNEMENLSSSKDEAGPSCRMIDDLPTARTMAPTGFRIHVWCKACRHSVDADLDALIRNGKDDIPLAQLKWQCGNCRSRLTSFVMTGSHFGPNRSSTR